MTGDNDGLYRVRRYATEKGLYAAASGQMNTLPPVATPPGDDSFVCPTDAHPSSRKFYAVLADAARLHDKKQRDYGTADDPFANVRASQDFGIPAWLGCMIRGNDKVVRVKSFATKGVLANESIEDALIDLLVYAGIALVLYREGQA